MLQDWTIQSRADRCEISGEPFADGKHFFTLLYREGKADTLRRRDVSAAAWRALQKDPSAELPFCFWRSRFTLPPPPAPEALPKADAEGLLRRFLSENRPEQRRAVYILAVMLERKKLLRPTDTRPDEESGQKLLFYEHARTGETFVVVDPALRLDQIAEVQSEVAALLKGQPAT